MMELMYEREGLFTISNIEPHGCKNTFRIPAHAVQEMKEQKQIKWINKITKEDCANAGFNCR